MEYVNKLTEILASSNINHDTEIMKLQSLKKAHAYCVIHSISAQRYGPILEKYIRTKFKYKKNSAGDCTGDCSRDGMNTEIKVSLGGRTYSKFNFVQLRPNHNCDTYILTAYCLSMDNVESEGELFIFKISHADIIRIIVEHGGYAHGTINKHGKITTESVIDNTNDKEYAIRPKYGDKCWKALMSYRITESEI